MLPQALQPTVSKITSLSWLPRGWDSYGADAITEAAIGRAIGFLTLLVGKIDYPIRPPIVGPGVNGAVVLQWHDDDDEVVIRLEADGGDYYVATKDVLAEGNIDSLEAAVERLARCFQAEGRSRKLLGGAPS